MTTIIDAMSDPECFGPWFEGGSWGAWCAVLKGAFALPMTPQELITFGELAGGRAPPKRRVRELWTAAGRRAGKDSIASLVATFAAAIEQAHLGRLRPGEIAVVQCLAVDRDQARIVLSYIKAFFAAIPDLGAMVTRETRYGLELNNGVSIEVATNSFRQARGRTVLLSILDELAYYRAEDSASPDFEVYRAITPSLATLPDSMLIAISSPYRRAGLLYEKWKAHFGKDTDDVLVIQASSAQLNPTLDPTLIARALEEDPAAARSDWLGLWRDDLASFLEAGLIESCTDLGVTVRPPRAGVHYVAFADAASGTGQDSFTAAVAHKDGQEIVLDLVHEVRPPFNPQSAIGEVCSLLKSYGVTAVTGDKWAPGFVADGFQRNGGIRYSYSERDRSQVYVECLPLLTSGRARLVDSKRLVLQFAGLERATSAGGRDRINHGVNGHDDVCNAAAGALTLAASAPQGMHISDEVLRLAALPPRHFAYNTY